jgi:hypothetical protein
MKRMMSIATKKPDSCGARKKVCANERAAAAAAAAADVGDGSAPRGEDPGAPLAPAPAPADVSTRLVSTPVTRIIKPPSAVGALSTLRTSVSSASRPSDVTCRASGAASRGVSGIAT